MDLGEWVCRQSGQICGYERGLCECVLFTFHCSGVQIYLVPSFDCCMYCCMCCYMYCACAVTCTVHVLLHVLFHVLLHVVLLHVLLHVLLNVLLHVLFHVLLHVLFHALNVPCTVACTVPFQFLLRMRSLSRCTPPWPRSSLTASPPSTRTPLST